MIPIPANSNYPYGDGGYSDFTLGTPMPANFFGLTGWWTVPGSWFYEVDGKTGQQWVSPNADFSTPKYACKTNLDGCLVFQSATTPVQNNAAAPLSITSPLRPQQSPPQSSMPTSSDTGIVSLSVGQDSGTVSGLHFGFTPRYVETWVMIPTGGAPIGSAAVLGTFSDSGFNFILDAQVPDVGYILGYEATA